MNWKGLARQFGLVAVLAAGPSLAQAQQTVTVCTMTVTPNGGVNCVPVGSGNPLPTTGSGVGGSVQSTAAQVVGFGNLAGASASTLVSTVTTGPSSGAWPNSPGQVYVINPVASAAIAYVCALGGSCSAANGLAVNPGSWYGFYKPSTSMTVYQASGSSVQIQW
jgi:hypothetical protein